MEVRLFNGRMFKSDNFEEVINYVKNSNTFTENLTIDEYIEAFKDRYYKIYPYGFWGGNDFEVIVGLMVRMNIIEFV